MQNDHRIKDCYLINDDNRNLLGHSPCSLCEWWTNHQHYHIHCHPLHHCSPAVLLNKQEADWNGTYTLDIDLSRINVSKSILDFLELLSFI